MSGDYPSKDELKGAVQGTLLYLALYLCILIPYQSFTKIYLYFQKRKEAKQKEGDEKKVSWRAVKYYNSRDMLALTGDRTVGNFVEFAILFLPLYWMHAIFVDPTQSFRIGCIYTATRAIYPIVYQMRGFLALSTGPGYLLYLYLMVEIARRFVFA
mmetsp:Transcript_20495/g.47417  ORF Transcript_20495/g.47417 Transcript_20495/m.47417 type:complete len:156 (+) Transcript_20495:97-564(+)